MTNDLFLLVAVCSAGSLQLQCLSCVAEVLWVQALPAREKTSLPEGHPVRKVQYVTGGGEKPECSQPREGTLSKLF